MGYERKYQDFKSILGTIFCNVNHKYIQLYRYYDIIKKLSCKNTMAYSIILYEQICRSACNRVPTMYGTPYIRIDNIRGKIKNKDELNEFLCAEGYMKCNAEHLIHFNSPMVWYKCFRYLLDIGLLDMQGSKITPMVPVDGRFLPINYAYVAFLSRIKKDSLLKKSISESLSKIPEKLKEELNDFDKDELISEIVYLKTRNIETHKNSPIYKMLFEDVSKKYPHKWGQSNPQKERINFVEEVMKWLPSEVLQNSKEIELQNDDETFSEISPDKTVKAINEKSRIKPVEKRILKVDDISRFEMGIPNKRTYQNESPGNQNTHEFFGIRPEDTARIVEKEKEEIEQQEQLEKQESEFIFDNFDDINDIDQDTDVDLFGIPIEKESNDLEIELPELPELPETLNKKPDLSDFWNQTSPDL